MEALILGWYVLVTTGSVKQLAMLAALAWLGSLFSPFLGLAGDRIGHRNVLCITRVMYALLAAVLTALTLTDSLQTWHAFVVAGSAVFERAASVGQPAREAVAVGLQLGDTRRQAGSVFGQALDLRS